MNRKYLSRSKSRRVWAVAGPRGVIGYHKDKRTAQEIASEIRASGGSAWAQPARMKHTRSSSKSYIFVRGARKNKRTRTRSRR